MQFDWKTLVRGRAPIGWRDIGRGGFGMLAGLAVTGFAARAVMDGRLSASPLLIAPIGASAVMVFTLPASPLAQPRAVIGGNLLAALIGVSCALAIPHPAIAAPAAAAIAMMAMAALGCLHPPGASIALGAALAAATTRPADYVSVLAPVALCSILLVATASLYGRLTRHPYPHRVSPRRNVHGAKDVPPTDRVGFRLADLDAALAQYGELLDVSREDLDALFRQVELQAHRRIHAEIRCEDVMSRDVIFVHADQTTESALAYIQAHDLRTAPVLDADGRLVGMARRAELLAGRGRKVEAVLDPFVHKVRPGTPIEALLPLLSSGSAHEAMVVDKDRKLLGVITQTDLLAVLYRAHVVEAVVTAKAA